MALGHHNVNFNTQNKTHARKVSLVCTLNATNPTELLQHLQLHGVTIKIIFAVFYAELARWHRKCDNYNLKQQRPCNNIVSYDYLDTQDICLVECSLLHAVQQYGQGYYLIQCLVGKLLCTRICATLGWNSHTLDGIINFSLKFQATAEKPVKKNLIFCRTQYTVNGITSEKVYYKGKEN